MTYSFLIIWGRCDEG
ncbi:hypothetical protein vseg_021355 [Gypsophila vaccaria]